MKAIIGQKLGMTQHWDDKGRLIGVTVIKAEPNIVFKTGDHLTIAAPKRGRLHKSQAYLSKHFSGNTAVEVKSVKNLDSNLEKVRVTDFKVGDIVSVSAKSKGKGFAGTIKRHGFSRGPVSHGSSQQRKPGSIGSQRPQRVIKGQKMAGHMGSVKKTIRGIKILDINEKENIMILAGSVPGARKSSVIIKETAKPVEKSND